MSEQGKPDIIITLEKELGVKLTPGPAPDLLVRDDYALHYAVNENNELIGLNLAGCALQSLELGSEFQHLQVLNVGRTALRSLHIPAEMKALRELRAYECKEQGKVELPDSLEQLHYLDLSECALSRFQLPKGLLALTKLYLQKNQLQELKWPEACPALIFADISKNQLNSLELPAGLEQLRFLYLGNNELNSLPCQGDLPQLEVLDLRNNTFKNIKESFLQHFPQAFTLYLSGNPLNLYLRGNFDANSDRNNLPQLQNYFTDLRNGTELDNECKVLLIGDGGAGKSCMVERLVWDSFEKKWLSTHGINIVPYPLGKYQLLLWDFAGQDIYHATHRLFMQANAVYVLAFSKTTQTNTHSELEEAGEKRPYQNYGVLYWWNYAQVLGKGSPILLAQTNWQSDGTWTDTDIEALQKANQNRLEILHLDAKYEEPGKNKYAALKLAMEEAVTDIRPLDEIPASAYALRKALRERRSDKVKSIPYAEYLSMASECQLERDPHECLVNWLDKSGVVYYRKGLFNEQVILDQEWAMNAVYSIFKRDGADAYYHRFVSQKGRVSGADLQMVWKQHSQEEQQLFLSFLESCEMCFELNKEERHQEKPFAERIFIFPQLLPEWKELAPLISDIWEDKEKLYLLYNHQFLHYGVIQSFIVQTQHTVQDITRSIWRQGILLKEDKQFAQVEAKSDKELLVTITPQSFPLLQKVRNLLAKLQDSPGLESVSSNGVDFVNLEHLQNNRDRPDILDEAGKTYVQVKPLLPFLERDEKAAFMAEKMSEYINDKGDATIYNKKIANPDKTLPNIPDLIGASRLKEALEALAASAAAELQADVILLQARYNVLVQSERRNTITQADANVERARINEGALELCASVTGNVVPEMEASAELSRPTSTEKPKTGGKKIFISYSEKDQSFVDEFLAHLSSLKRSGKISSWHSRQVLPGDEKDAAIHEELQGADIILLMVSASFLNTDYIWDMEIAVAMERHERKAARVIPIILKPCDLEETPFSKLSGLPVNGKPVSAYADRDEAWLEVVKGIARVLDR